MKKVILSTIATSFLLGSIVHADVQFDPEAFEVAINRAMIKADVVVFCGQKGKAFTQDMATLLRDIKNTIPNLQPDSAAAMKSIESSAKNYEGLCEKAIKSAVASGATDLEVSQLLTEK